jgi:YhcN/YlaJ family sporulation lipoprotein
MGDERARDLNDVDDGLDTRYQGYGARLGNNLTGMDRNNMGQNDNFGGNMAGTNRWSIARDGTISNTPGNTTGLNNTTGNGMSGNTTLTGVAGNDSRRAAMIERQLENTGGIDDCVVLVNGDTALVGLRTRGGYTANLSGLRASIERRVKQIDNSIRNVRVTDSRDILTRMSRLGTTGLNNNGTTGNFMDEFNDLINRIDGTVR